MESWKLVAAGGSIALAGMVLGAWLFGAAPARAQRAHYRECMVGVQEALDVNNSGTFAPYRLDHAVLIPDGWEIVGGGGGGLNGYVIVCR